MIVVECDQLNCSWKRLKTEKRAHSHVDQCCVDVAAIGRVEGGAGERA
jgi:hypothetical protein